MKEYVILSLRKINGLNIDTFKTKFKKDIYELFSEELNELFKDNLIYTDNKNIMLTDRGLEVANLVWEKFV